MAYKKELTFSEMVEKLKAKNISVVKANRTLNGRTLYQILGSELHDPEVFLTKDLIEIYYNSVSWL